MKKAIYNDAYHRLIQNLRRSRIDQGMTQAKVGRRIGRTRYWVSQVETRAVRLDVVQYVALCRTLGLCSSRLIRRLEREVSPDEGEPLFTYQTSIGVRNLVATWWPLFCHKTSLLTGLAFCDMSVARCSTGNCL